MTNAAQREADDIAASRAAARKRRGRGKKSKTAWNSLEVAKLLVAATTPILLAFFGLIVTRASHDKEDLRTRKATAEPILAGLQVNAQIVKIDLDQKLAQLRNQQEPKKRGALLDSIYEDMNDYNAKAAVEFVRLRFLINDDRRYMQFEEAFFRNTRHELNEAVLCSAKPATLVQDYVESAKCTHQHLDLVYRCPALITDIIRNVETLPLVTDQPAVKDCGIDSSLAIHGTKNVASTMSIAASNAASH